MFAAHEDDLSGRQRGSTGVKGRLEVQPNHSGGLRDRRKRRLFGTQQHRPFLQRASEAQHCLCVSAQDAF